LNGCSKKRKQEAIHTIFLKIAVVDWSQMLCLKSALASVIDLAFAKVSKNVSLISLSTESISFQKKTNKATNKK
jgi:hypothetical protein